MIYSLKIQFLLSSYSGVEKNLRHSTLAALLLLNGRFSPTKWAGGSLPSGLRSPTKRADWATSSLQTCVTNAVILKFPTKWGDVSY